MMRAADHGHWSGRECRRCHGRSDMKSILLPVDQSDTMPAVLETARLLADMFASTVEGVALRPAFADIVAPDPIVAVTIPPADWNEADFTRSVRQTFDAFAAGHPAPPGRSEERRVGKEWRSRAAAGEAADTGG